MAGESTNKFEGSPEHVELSASDGDTYEAETFSPELTDALAKERIGFWSKNTLRLLPILIVGFLNSCMNGFDGSIMSGINVIPSYLHHFGLSNTSPSTGLVFAMYSAGSLVSVPFAGPISDILGRRYGMFIGSLFIIAGTVVVVTAPHTGQFIGGRFLLGFGVNIAVSAAPAYVLEMSPQQYRGRMTGMYNVFYFAGAISASWIMYGTNHMKTNWSWRIPLLLQLVPSTLIAASCLFLPESPRWHMAHGNRDRARAILVKYHAYGNEDSPIVDLQMREMDELIELDGTDKRWWDYSGLISSRSARYRLFCLWSMTFLASFTGNAVISYFLPVMLQEAGITSTNEQLLVNALNIVCSAICAVIGCLFVDKAGRRKLLLGGTAGLCVCLCIVTALTKTYANTSNGTGAPAKATIAFIILFGCAYSAGWTPMQALYPLECLNFTIRAKGMSISGLFVGLSSFVSLYSSPPGIGRLKWKFYIVFVAIDVIVFIVIYFFFPETKGRTLEELDEIFEAKNPVKMSLAKKNVVVSRTEGVRKILVDEKNLY